ncbi:MAG: DinB family protein [Coprobacillaceae bacterium]
MKEVQISRSSIWNPLQKKLRENIKKEEMFIDSKELLLHLHGLLHQKEVYQSKEDTFLDQLYQITDNNNWAIMPGEKDVTVVWNLWHITRIEDLTLNLLIKPDTQVLNENWLQKLNTSVTDTGNAMSDEEIMKLSKEINFSTLQQYRKAVGEKTRQVLSSLTYQDIFRKVNTEDIQKIIDQGGLTSHPDSIWLADFWGRKDIAGLLLMPITRHQIGHINDSFTIIKKVNSKNEFYMQ